MNTAEDQEANLDDIAPLAERRMNGDTQPTNQPPAI